MSSEGFYLLGTRFPSPPVTSIRVRKLLEVFVTTTRATGAGLQSTAHASQRFPARSTSARAAQRA
eukprot:CAMPEP_0185158062 /NCGR_PEP_ID=MMETSP1139-20130426/2171_1 /TAXON_ID=298111 /ORGANISM="Pavlova sp., Strain CCMP459" /LENGTH=64 /DNA_ID=CAMNT_0027723179 /DNA_START=440 /DNA_END=634 /DNA_ORIENTATION=+